MKYINKTQSNFAMKKLIFLFFVSLSLSAWSVIPAGYYSAAEGKSGDALRTALQSIVTAGSIDLGYSGLWTAYATTDLNASGKIWDMYSNCVFTLSANQCGNYAKECDCYNREHTTPQSWFNSAAPMVSDLYNVFPTDGKVNGIRSNYPFGEVQTATTTTGNGSKLGSSALPNYAGTVFEPIDVYKGDLARTFFYMATRYASVCQNWTAGASDLYGSNSGLSAYGVALFLKWMRQDAVSTKETNRNDAVHKVQRNRNPFVDYPELAEYIWGVHKGEAWSTTTSISQQKMEFSLSMDAHQNQLEINITFPNLKYTIYNTNGQAIQQGNINNSNIISVSNFSNGMYLIVIQSGNNCASKKFIVYK